MDNDNLAEVEISQMVTERRRLFRILVYGSFAMMGMLFLAGVYWMSGPDAYHEGLQEQQAEAPRWPDGSPRTPDDWWADPSLAHAPETPATTTSPGG